MFFITNIHFPLRRRDKKKKGKQKGGEEGREGNIDKKLPF